MVHLNILLSSLDKKSAVKRDNSGTKCCAWMSVQLPAKGKTCVYWQMFPADSVGESTIRKLDQLVEKQRFKADAFYHEVSQNYFFLIISLFYTSLLHLK